MNYDNKKFRVKTNTSNGEVDNEMIFQYQQKGNIVTCTYKGDSIITGHLLGTVDNEGIINMNYHQINSKGELMTGKCTSSPCINSKGLIELYEEWQWTSGDFSSGKSVLEEVL